MRSTRLYRVINDIIADLDPAPGDALRNLAAIDDLRLFVSTTPDRLLAKAVNEVRFGKRRVSFRFPRVSPLANRIETREPASATDTVVLNLFGQATSTPQYAIHDEDRLEWLHALLTDAASLPEWLVSPAEASADAVRRLRDTGLARAVSPADVEPSRLSLERDQQFFFVGNSISREPALSTFFATYCRKTLVQQLDMEPTTFVSELHARWEKRMPLGRAYRPRPRHCRGDWRCESVSLRTLRRSLSATCVRTPTPPGGWRRDRRPGRRRVVRRAPDIAGR